MNLNNSAYNWEPNYIDAKQLLELKGNKCICKNVGAKPGHYRRETAEFVAE